VAELSMLLEKSKSARVADRGLGGLLQSLREGGVQQRGLSSNDIASIEAAASFLRVPVDSRPQWNVTQQENAKPRRGLFCVFEGLDRSGKSTQSKRLAKHLENAGPVKWMCFPDRATPSGALIDLYLRNKIELSDEEIHLLFSANRWEASQSIVAELSRGVSVICDRYAFSGVAYSAAKGLEFSWCQSPDLGLPAPDAVFFLHIDEKVGASRSNFGDERYENASMQANVRNQFQLPRLREGINWHDVDGARDIEVISAEIRTVVEALRQEDQENQLQRNIGRLWLTAAVEGTKAGY
jgi:dTMP kinase